MNTPKLFFSVAEVAKATGTGLTKIREEISSGRLPASKLGRRTIVSAEALAAWAAALPPAHRIREGREFLNSLPTE